MDEKDKIIEKLKDEAATKDQLISGMSQEIDLLKNQIEELQKYIDENNAL